MEGLLVFIVLTLVILVGWWILETVADGVVSALFALIAAPFKAAGKAHEKSKMDTYVSGVGFDTSTPPDRLHKALADHFNKGEFHPTNRVIVQTNEPGRFVIGIAWHEEVTLQLESGDSARSSGLPVVVAELAYGARGPRTGGRVRLTRFPHERGWAENAVMDHVFPWCFAPIVDLDPSARLYKHENVQTASQVVSAFHPPSPAPAPSDPHAEYRRQAAHYFGTAASNSDPRSKRPTKPIDRYGQYPAHGASEQQPPNLDRPLWSPAPLPRPRLVLFALHPWHALWALGAVCALFAVFSSSMFGWILLALLCAGGGWYARSRNAAWPSDVRDVLVRMRLASPAPGTSSPTPPPPPVTQPQGAIGFAPKPASATQPVGASVGPPIPFRPMTIPELFTGAARIMARNWPTLVGISVGILLAFVLFLYISVTAIVHFILDTSSALNGGTLFNLTNPDSFMPSLVILFIVFTVVVMAVALPADALLLALSVIATNKAVRGQPVRLTEVWTQARRRMFAVCRMTLTFYLMSALPDVVLIGLLSLGAGMAILFFSVAITFAIFAASIVFSLSPIVLAVEGRGVVDSLRRSLSLSKPAWGRIIGIHLLWSVCIIPVVMVTLVFGFNLLIYAVAAGILLACFRVLQVLIYTDLRIRQEHYEHWLIEEWTRNTGRSPV